MNTWTQDQNWWHFTGIGGITTGQLAVALAKNGAKVTGSDEGLYEPMKSYLATCPEIKLSNEYSFKNLIKSTYTGKEEDKYIIPGHIVALGSLPSQNKELLFAKIREIPVKHYAEVLTELVVVPNSSIVVAGSFAKSTVTGLLGTIFKTANTEISYMCGAMLAQGQASMENGIVLKIASSKYSVIEGDEYLSANWDKQSKFFYYCSTYLLITGYAYDHTDLFTTPEAYFENFKKLIEQLPQSGMLIYNTKFPDLVELAKFAPCQTYGYLAQDLPADLEHNLIGAFNLENLAAAFTTAKLIGVSEETIRQGIKNFKGVKRRLETVISKELAGGKRLTVISDFGSTSGKALAAIEAISSKYPTSDLYCIFEPNLGNRTATAYKLFADQAVSIWGRCKVLFLPEFKQIPSSEILGRDELATSVTVQLGETTKVNSLKDASEIAEVLQTEITQSSNPEIVVAILCSGEAENYISALNTLN